VLEIYAQCGHIAVSTCTGRVGPGVLAFLGSRGPAPGATVAVPDQPAD